MKKVLLAILTISLFVYSADAQIKKGSIFLGGDIAASSQKTKYDNGNDRESKALTITPVFGKFVRDNLVVGGSLSFSRNRTVNDFSVMTRFNNYGASVFMRKYKPIGKNGFFVFLQGGLTGNYLTTVSRSPMPQYNEEMKRTSISLGANPGISFAVNKKLHLETGFNNLLAVSYFNERRSQSGASSGPYRENGFSIFSSLSNATSQLYVGFRVLLEK